MTRDGMRNIIMEDPFLPKAIESLDGVDVTGGHARFFSHLFNSYTLMWYLKDHLGSIRVALDNSGNVLECNDYYPFGLRTDLGRNYSTNIVNRYKYNGKELQTTLTGGIDYIDYGARMYDPVVARFTTMDAFAERYAHVSPYQYAIGNPINFIDVNGDSLSVEAQYQETVLNSLKETFGEYAQNFSFNQRGMLEYNGSTKGMSGTLKSILNDMSQMLESEDITFLHLKQSITVSGTKIDAANNNGAVTALASETGLNNNYIVIDPSGKPTTIYAWTVTKEFYKETVDNTGPARYIEQAFESNLTDKLFHEFGHVIFDGKKQSLVIDFNNKARKILNLPKRKYDSEHNFRVVGNKYNEFY